MDDFDDEDGGGGGRRRRSRSKKSSSSSSSNSRKRSSRTLEVSICNDDLVSGPNVAGGGAGLDEDFPTGGGDDDDDANYDNVPFFEKKQEMEATDRFCWGCAYGFAPSNTDPKIRTLFEMFANNIATRRDTELAEEMHEYHEKYIRAPRLACGEKCEEWPSNMILIHVRRHQFFAKVELMGSVQGVKILQNIVENDVLKRHRDTKKEKTNLEAIRSWVMLERLKQSLMKESTAKYTALNEDGGMDR